MARLSNAAGSSCRGGNTTLLRPDFKPAPIDRQISGGGAGGGSGGNDNGSGGSGGPDSEAEDDEAPKQQPRFLWGRALLAAGAAAAAVEQLLKWPKSPGRILALLALGGALAAWQGAGICT
jgi:hypothetical protein